MSPASPKPFSITFAPSRAKASAMPRPIPLVEPVTSAAFPESDFIVLRLSLPSYLLATLVRKRGRRAQHFDVHDPVLVVRLSHRHEAEAGVELLQVALRADAQRLARPEFFRLPQRFGHELASI